MAFAIRDRTETTLSEINVTPLVDVILVLLIIFMVTAPMLSANVEVNLEQASVTPSTDKREHLVISVTADGHIYVADVLTDIDLVMIRAKETMARTGIRDVAIRGDKRVGYGVVLQILDRLHAAGIPNVGLVMDPPETVGAPR